MVHLLNFKGKIKMALPNFITRTLVMKQEVNKIFDDLEAWLDHCRLELIEFNPAHLYKSKEYKDWNRSNNKGSNKQHRQYRSKIKNNK
jgi:hypothetical protein